MDETSIVNMENRARTVKVQNSLKVECWLRWGGGAESIDQAAACA